MAVENTDGTTVEFPSRFREEAAASTGLLFIRVYNLWHGEVRRALVPCGLTHPQFVFLACAGYLAQANTYVTQSMIAALADMDLMTVSQLATLLEKKELITRRQHPEDSRAKAVSLSEEGQRRLSLSIPVVEAIDRAFFSRLGMEEADLQRMLRALGAGHA